MFSLNFLNMHQRHQESKRRKLAKDKESNKTVEQKLYRMNTSETLNKGLTSKVTHRLKIHSSINTSQIEDINI
jgi:hypothetical protein